MSSGKAKGRNRDYQVFVRDVLMHTNPQLIPYQGDGVDVTFKIKDANAKMTIDVVLEDAQGHLIAGECKRWNLALKLKQNEIFAFQQKLDELRKITEKEVTGVFFVKHAFQLGAIKLADYYGIRVITCNEQQPLEGFSLTNLHYDPVRGKQTRQGEAYVGGSLGISGDLALKVFRPRSDGTFEEIDGK